MLFLMQSTVVIYQARQGGINETPAIEYVEPDDDDLLMAWFTYMARYYGRTK